MSKKKKNSMQGYEDKRDGYLVHLEDLVAGLELDLADARGLQDATPGLHVGVHLHHLVKQEKKLIKQI